MRRPRPPSLTAHAVALGIGCWALADVRPPGPGDRRTGPAPSSGAWPRVSVVIPARNEEGALPVLLASLAVQTRPADEVLVVDDHSEDRTAEVAQASGAAVLRPAVPPPGWLGKPWACHHGAGAATGELLLFLDADVRLAPAALEALVGDWSRTGGVLSVQPHHRTRAAYEQLSAVCNVVTMMGTGAFSAGPRRAVDMAFGPCLAVGRDDYERAGGHAHLAVRDRIAEDVALARRVRATGGTVRVAAGGGLVEFRMYPGGVRQLVEGWSKMLAGGAAAAPTGPALLTAVWITGALRGAGCGWRALRGVGGRRRGGVGGRRRGGVALDAAVYAAWAVEMRWAMRRAGHWKGWTAAAFPVPLLAFVALTARSAFLTVTGRPTRWRGREVKAN